MEHIPTPTSETSSADSDCKSGRRNRYFVGKRMKADEFRLEQRYLIERRRLINRSVLGWGVVDGFALPLPERPSKPCVDQVARVEDETDAAQDPEQASPRDPGPGARPAPLRVTPGFALDHEGREIVLEGTVTLGVKNTILITPGSSGMRSKPITGLARGRYILAVHYAERLSGDIVMPSSCSCGDPERSELCESAMFSLRPIDDECHCPCGEPACPDGCACINADSCCLGGRGPHARLCAWVTERTLSDPHARLLECHGLAVALDSPVDLACVTIEGQERWCDPLLVLSIDDACGPRRVVKNNDLLYDLLRGCDLTTIAWISWEAWHRKLDQRVPWEKFAALMMPPSEPSGVTDLIVRFSRPVRIDYLLPDAIVITAYTIEQSTGWRIGKRMPIVELMPAPSVAGLPDGTTDQVRIRVRPNWLNDEIKKESNSWLTYSPFMVEIEIRGDLIVDCNGQSVDANARGLRAAPSGNGTPGGTFLSSFNVENKPRTDDPTAEND